MATRQENEIKVREGAAVWRDMDGEAVLLGLDSSKYLQLNRTATVLWLMLVQGTTRQSLVDRLVAEFGLDQVDAERDVGVFLERCREHRLLASLG